MLGDATNYSTTADLQKWRKVLASGTVENVKKLGLKTNNKLFETILKEGYIKSDVALDFVEDEKVQKLIETNVLSAHANKTLSFQAHHVCMLFKKEFGFKGDCCAQKE